MRPIALTLILTLLLSSSAFTRSIRKLEEKIEPDCTPKWPDYRDDPDCCQPGASAPQDVRDLYSNIMSNKITQSTTKINNTPSLACAGLGKGFTRYNDIPANVQKSPEVTCMQLHRNEIQFKDLDSELKSNSHLICVAMNKQKLSWTYDTQDLKEDCQTACCGLRTRTVSWNGLKKSIQRFCDVSRCMGRSGDHRRLSSKKVRVERRLSTPPPCDNKSKWIDYRENHNCGCEPTMEDSSEVRDAIFRMRAAKINNKFVWENVPAALRDNSKVLCAAMDFGVEWKNSGSKAQMNQNVICQALSKKYLTWSTMPIIRNSDYDVSHLVCVAMSSGAMTQTEVADGLNDDCQSSCCALRSGLADWNQLNTYVQQMCNVGRCGTPGH